MTCPRCAHPLSGHRLGACEFDWMGQPTLPCGCNYPLPASCPTCSGPVRETVGMVCQTCGTDYATEEPR